jgi:hypothetical protein
MKISIDISFLRITIFQLELVLFQMKERVIPSEKVEEPFHARFSWPEESKAEQEV